MPKTLKLAARAMGFVILLGALWPWVVPVFSRVVASLADMIFVGLHQPFGAQATPEGIELRWQPLRYTTFGQLQEQMGYVDRFARQGLQGHRLLTVDAFYLQAGVLVVLALLLACPGFSATQRFTRIVLALGLIALWQALDLCVSAHIEFQLRLRTLSRAGALLILNDPEWYLYYGLRPLSVVSRYLWPWLIGGGLTYRLWQRMFWASARDSMVTYEAQRA